MGDRESAVRLQDPEGPRSTLSLAFDRLMTQFETKVQRGVAQRNRRDSLLEELHVRRAGPALMSRACSNISSASPGLDLGWADAFGGEQHIDAPPEPRSRTVSPGCSPIRAVGLPHPSEAATASAGSSDVSRSEYSCAVIGSAQPHATGPQQPSRRNRPSNRAYFS